MLIHTIASTTCTLCLCKTHPDVHWTFSCDLWHVFLIRCVYSPFSFHPPLLHVPNFPLPPCSSPPPPPPSPPFRVGGSLPVLFPYNSEFIRNKYRGPYLGVQSTFWMVGRLLCGAFAWIIIPQSNINMALGTIHFRSWRLFLAVSALPSILGSLLYFILPESPRYLLEVGKERKALKVLCLVYKINHLFRKDVPEYPVSTFVHNGAMDFYYQSL